MVNLLKALILVPIAVIAITFAVANRQMATISLDPFNPTAPALALNAPLFLIILSMVMLGVLIGGIATWLTQGHARIAARHGKAESERLRREVQEARLELDLVHRQAATARTATQVAPALPALSARELV